jgi:hypothetical protein
MSYIRTKLSYDDKDILDEIYDELEEITLPSSFRNKGGQGHQIKTGTTTQRNARQTIFGTTTYQGKKRKSSMYKEISIYDAIVQRIHRFTLSRIQV